MDTSPEYIKMCEKAWPDLAQHEAIYSRRIRMLYVLDGEVVVWGKSVNTENHKCTFPLWEQDQLQKMMGLEFWPLFDKFVSHHSYWNGEAFLKKYEKYAVSFEQVWLAFVMYDKYNKKWTGKDWVNA